MILPLIRHIGNKDDNTIDLSHDSKGDITTNLLHDDKGDSTTNLSHDNKGDITTNLSHDTGDITTVLLHDDEGDITANVLPDNKSDSDLLNDIHVADSIGDLSYDNTTDGNVSNDNTTEVIASDEETDIIKDDADVVDFKTDDNSAGDTSGEKQLQENVVDKAAERAGDLVNGKHDETNKVFILYLFCEHFCATIIDSIVLCAFDLI